MNSCHTHKAKAVLRKSKPAQLRTREKYYHSRLPSTNPGQSQRWRICLKEVWVILKDFYKSPTWQDLSNNLWNSISRLSDFTYCLFTPCCCLWMEKAPVFWYYVCFRMTPRPNNDMHVKIKQTKNEEGNWEVALTQLTFECSGEGSLTPNVYIKKSCTNNYLLHTSVSEKSKNRNIHHKFWLKLTKFNYECQEKNGVRLHSSGMSRVYLLQGV